uniref:Uncharacterized protein n=1 Tax=Oncorhynchus mykiss TaxID=8022 RepID=A0A8C7VIU5_ONCMY
LTFDRLKCLNNIVEDVLDQGWATLMGVGDTKKSELIMRGHSGLWSEPFGGPKQNIDRPLPLPSSLSSFLPPFFPPSI